MKQIMFFLTCITAQSALQSAVDTFNYKQAYILALNELTKRTAEEKIEADRAQLFHACKVDNKNEPAACQKALAALYKSYIF